jgi:hypothetical protein
MSLAYQPAIVAIGHSRSDALSRLLGSLRAGEYPSRTPLVISLDHSDDEAVGALAEAFDWPHGPKRVIRHPARLGLREHVLRCGDLTLEYGGIVLFEDDLLAAPGAYGYATQAMAFYADAPRVGGIALYSYQINEFNNLDFRPIADGSDVYFLQVAASWGQAWTAGQWAAFRQWYAAEKDNPISTAQGLPRQLQAWKASSWKKFYIKYLVATDRYFVYPRMALSTNTARPGTHTKRAVSIYQTPMDLDRRRQWRFRSIEQSLALYDVFYEPRPETLARLRPELRGLDFDVDLMGARPADGLTRPLLLSSRPCGQPFQRFGLRQGSSPADDVADGAPGEMFSLGPRSAFGAMTQGRRLKLIRALHGGRATGKMLFQMLKPIQTELRIALSRTWGARAGGASGR